ncbi:hypothetical protein AKJ16_DCAP09817 [Drosera capensis]
MILKSGMPQFLPIPFGPLPLKSIILISVSRKQALSRRLRQPSAATGAVNRASRLRTVYISNHSIIYLACHFSAPPQVSPFTRL